MPPPIGLVIFDCDGVLVDSEPIAMRVLLAQIAAQGGTVAVADAFRDFLGRSLESISRTLSETHALSVSAEVLAEMRHALFAAYQTELRPAPWLVETLDRLSVPTCVASSSGVERIRFSLEVTRLLPRFDGRIYSAAMVARGKPAPDLFLHAARQMGVRPENCLVIEDSPAGVRAAQAAGMRVFAYLGGSHVAPAGLAAEIAALGPDAVFEDMRALTGLMALHEARATGAAPNLVAAVDVGTGSARAGILDVRGNFLARAEMPFGMHRPDGDIAEHDSEEIWSAACAAMRAAMADSGVAPIEVVGLAFDATCSLVMRAADGAQVTVSATGADRLDTISWMDHRAQREAAEATATGHRVIAHVGGVMSPEMQVPKLMWLKRHLPASWTRAALLFDLSDFLSWKATGSPTRSQCTLACKWTYLPEGGGWHRDFLAAVGLDDLFARTGVPETATPIGADVGALTPDAAVALGLTPACRVGMGLIDAHAGALGSGLPGEGQPSEQLTLVGGTSSCVMALSADARPIHGVWGPFAGAVLNEGWLNEAGQSATGALLDHVIRNHAAGGEPTPERHAEIIARIGALRDAEGEAFAARLHVLPDFHGNRSPLGMPEALGVVSGLSLDESFDGLCRLYYRTAVGIALGLRHILETLRAAGYATEALHVAGGHVRNSLLMELYADAAQVMLIESEAMDATLLGVAMVAATGAGLHPDLAAARTAMLAPVRRYAPRASHEKDYQVFREMLAQRAALERLIAG